MDIYIRLTLEGEDFLNNQLLSGFVDDFKCKFIERYMEHANSL